MLLSALVLDTSLTLKSNYILDQLQFSIKAIKFWCGYNYILINVTLQLFLTTIQVCYLKGDICNVHWSETKRDPPSFTFNPKPKVTIVFLHWPEKRGIRKYFSRNSLNTILVWLLKSTFSLEYSVMQWLLLILFHFWGIWGSPTHLLWPVASEQLVQLCIFIHSKCSSPHVVKFGILKMYFCLYQMKYLWLIFKTYYIIPVYPIFFRIINKWGETKVRRRFYRPFSLSQIFQCSTQLPASTDP